MSYQDFISGKFKQHQSSGIDVELPDCGLFPHQFDLVKWALRKGRAAIFADTGLGKSRMQITWADQVVKNTNGSVMILAPLAVAQQTVEEAKSIGVDINHCREPEQLKHGINITNYDRIHKFDCSIFTGVVLDESSIIKHHDAKTLKTLLESFGETKFKLCATATPAPNDWTELGTHAEFLGVRSRNEMLSEFFLHDAANTQDWRLKGHAKHIFWKWVSTWAALVRTPADLGHDASMYELPPLEVTQHTVKSELQPNVGMLFAFEAQTLSERREARKASLRNRVDECAAMVNNDNQPWIVWCHLNDEADALKAAIPDAIEIRGTDDVDVKEQRLHDFSCGKIRVLITKPKIAGFGLNWQHCRRMAFVGVTDSFEAYYQAVRRCWRFGQKHQVHVHIFASEQEGAVVANLKRKEREVLSMAESLSAETLESVRSQVIGIKRDTNSYNAENKIQIPSFLKEIA